MISALKQKHLWLNAIYTSESTMEPTSYSITKTPLITNLQITGLDKNDKKYYVPKLSYTLTNNPDRVFTGSARLRWGNGNGVANIRWNIK